MTNPLPVLFLSGAGLPEWIWDDVRSSVDGDTRVANRPAAEGAPLAAYADAALSSAEGWERFAVVAHSVGGVVASELTARAPERIASVLAVAAVVPPAGRSFLDAMPFPQRHVVSLAMRVAGTRPPAKEISERLCRGVDPAVAERIVTEFHPESQRLYRDRVGAPSFPEARAYALTREDPEFAENLQRRFAENLGGAVHELPTGHLPMLEQPAAVADLVATVCQSRSSL